MVKTHKRYQYYRNSLKQNTLRKILIKKLSILE